jgi:hypothetical protein
VNENQLRKIIGKKISDEITWYLVEKFSEEKSWKK